MFFIKMNNNTLFISSSENWSDGFSLEIKLLTYKIVVYVCGSTFIWVSIFHVDWKIFVFRFYFFKSISKPECNNRIFQDVKSFKLLRWVEIMNMEQCIFPYQLYSCPLWFILPWFFCWKFQPMISFLFYFKVNPDFRKCQGNSYLT